MEWLDRLNVAIAYLEKHLEDEIDLTRVAQIVRCSPFHFQRMFSYLAEVPLGEYIRRRKMTRAAADLQIETERVIDIGATDLPAPEGLDEYIVPACTWAIFTCIGPMPSAIQNLQRRIVSEWLPSSGYEYANAPDIEVYFEGNQQAEDYRCEVWLPIIKN